MLTAEELRAIRDQAQSVRDGYSCHPGRLEAGHRHNANYAASVPQLAETIIRLCGVLLSFPNEYQGDVLREAVAAEREACAQIAEREQYEPGLGPGGDYDVYGQVARAIRRQQSLTPEELATKVIADRTPYVYTGGPLLLVSFVEADLQAKIAAAIREALVAQQIQLAEVADRIAAQLRMVACIHDHHLRQFGQAIRGQQP